MVQQSNEVEMNELQYMLFIRHPPVRHEVLIITRCIKKVPASVVDLCLRSPNWQEWIKLLDKA